MRITPDVLTRMLQAQGTLLKQSVLKDVQEVDVFSGQADRIVRLQLTSSDGTTRSVIAKIFGPEWYTGSGLPELRFYQSIAPHMPDIPVPSLLGAHHDPETSTAVLLIEDLGAEFELVSLPVASFWLEKLTEVLCKMHSRWWSHQDLNAPGFLVPETGVTRMPQALDQAGLAIHVRAARDALDRFLHLHRSDLTGQDVILLKRLSDAWPEKFAARTLSGQHLTLLHGDLHLLGNVFVPRSDPAKGLRIIDWTQAKRGLGPHDLMYMLLGAESENRRERDLIYLQQYHAGLIQGGVEGYAWEQCLWDFRFSILTNLWQSIFQGSLRWLRHTLEVVQVWEARELLDP
ncbi:phosphotransferase [Deinococcus cellulosilyticus]|uniref:Aminoglycoside phosphotransferase domain-containing protein n=1 Tax=Deinococcus cellulosilyticus (strain DSM 18568 / NBRC 106333 / KACC 11606 / 5516J-15) TaxID=1223518 RepID=A0A511MWL3_DEIC1|nr:phosphotransferase [Deinococcus cellulosilyticus]GEM44781.1 hypothetical protein DC3_04160 [Deinococcus cellulosilyticus NBRC 106333 = KACC 11606]